MVDNLVQQHIRAAIEAEKDYTRRKEALMSEYEAKGHRIISGTQEADGEWEVTDYRTDDIIAAGDGGLEGYDEVAHDHGQMWVHIDPIIESLDITDPITEGLPESLCEQLTDWVRERATDEDIDQVLALGHTPAPEPEVVAQQRRAARERKARERANDVAQQRHEIESLVQESGALTEESHTVRVHISDDDLAFVAVLGHHTRREADQFGPHLVVALKEHGFSPVLLPAEYGTELFQEVAELHPVTVLLTVEEQCP